MIVLDASALLAYLADEPGAAAVEAELKTGAAVCGAANWSEVAQKVRAHGSPWRLSEALLHSYSLEIEPVTETDAIQAAELWRPGSGLSLADRLCLALAHRRHVPVLTADRAWSARDTDGNDIDDIEVRQIR